MDDGQVYAVSLTDAKDNGPILVGGKAFNLSRLVSGGIEVPTGFCVTTAAFEEFAYTNGIRDLIAELARSFASADRKELAIQQIRESIHSARLPREVTVAVQSAYQSLSAATITPIVAVRSSATAEDSQECSFAGQLVSFLGISGVAALIEKVRACWAGAFSERVLAYCRAQGMRTPLTSIAVIVQKLVFAEKSGVAFSINPLTGNHEQIVIEGVWGLGESLVAGEITPDTWIVGKGSHEVLRRRIATKRSALTVSHGTACLETVEIPSDRQDVPCLEEGEVGQVADLVSKAEELFGCPQDIEWAIEGSRLLALQSRPVTTL